jgi:hypothetical protein
MATSTVSMVKPRNRITIKTLSEAELAGWKYSTICNMLTASFTNEVPSKKALP